MNRWVPVDHRYEQPRGLAAYSRRPAFKWIGLLVAWVIVTAILSITHLIVLLLVIMAGLICYVVYAVLRDTPPRDTPPASRRTAQPVAAADHVSNGQRRQQFNPPPGWPTPPPGWEPPPGWRPDQSWPSAPPGWEFWVWPYDEARGQRMGRYRRTGGNHRNGA